jgi:TetR/AcrR family transcriptional repressor for divergent bdcA
MAEALSNGGLKAIRAYLDQVHPQQAQAMTDYISVTLRGMSAAACNGMPRKRLLEVAQTAGRFLAHELASRTGNA